jgi:hypothetical protein
MNLDGIVRFFETLAPETVPRLGEIYTEDATFKDPFNDVRALVDIQAIFAHMFETLDEQMPPRVPDDAGYPPLIYKRQFVPPAELIEDARRIAGQIEKDKTVRNQAACLTHRLVELATARRGAAPCRT